MTNKDLGVTAETPNLENSGQGYTHQTMSLDKNVQVEWMLIM